MRMPLRGATKTARVLLFCAAAAALQGATHGVGTIEVGSDIHHSNGNVYDQLLLAASNDTVRADPGQVMRLSFIDLNDDIVQVEFTGAGSLTVTLENSSGPAVARKYNQPDVLYMKGHATLEIEGSNSTTQIAVFSVGKVTANNQAIFRPDAVYDGIADLALLYVKADAQNPNGSNFGGIRMGNVQFWRGRDRTGIYAPRVHVQDRVVIGDISAYDDAAPVLWFGQNSQFAVADVAGGDLGQPNGRLIQVSYAMGVSMLAGTTSSGMPLPAQYPRGQLVDEEGGVHSIDPPGGGPIWL